MYIPGNAEMPFPVVIFSHGLGGTREAAPYFGEALAKAGYLAVFIQHPGSDGDVWKDNKRPSEIKKALLEAVKNPDVVKNRYQDVHFVIDELDRLNKRSASLRKKFDMDRIGIAGHSFGAYTVLASAGQNYGSYSIYKDSRLKAGIALSPNIPRRYESSPDNDMSSVYSNIDIPVFHVTGTKDGNPINKNQKTFDPEIRTFPYKYSNVKGQCLMVLEGAKHSSFAGRNSKGNERYHSLIAESATLFFDAHLKGDDTARSRLVKEFPSHLKDGDSFECK